MLMLQPLFILFCMIYNQCLSLSYFLPLVQHCESILFNIIYLYLYISSPLLPAFFSTTFFSAVFLHSLSFLPFVLIPLFSPPCFLLCLIAPSSQRPVLPFPNLHGLAEAAETTGFAQLGALSASSEDGPCFRGSVFGRQPLFPTFLCTHR